MPDGVNTYLKRYRPLRERKKTPLLRLRSVETPTSANTARRGAPQFHLLRWTSRSIDTKGSLFGTKSDKSGRLQMSVPYPLQAFFRAAVVAEQREGSTVFCCRGTMISLSFQ